jgi:hypothetical protein
MANGEIERLLGVRWFDGLLVRQDHFAHSDSRFLAFLSESCALVIDQPGLFFIDSHTRSGSQLVSIEKTIQKDDDTIEVFLNILRPFQAVTANGTILMGLPNNNNQPGIPSPSIKTKITSSNRDELTFLICVKQVVNAEPKFEKNYGSDNSIELIYPSLQAVLVKPDDFNQNLFNGYELSIPLALLKYNRDKPEIDSSYIPPVIRLKQVEFFDTGVVSMLSKTIDDICEISARYLSAGHNIFSQGDISMDLRARYNYYHVLNALLLSKSGITKRLEELSPVRFLDEIMVPIAKWFDQYYRILKKRGSNADSVAKACEAILSIPRIAIYTRTDALLKLSATYLTELLKFLDTVA